MYTVIFMDKNHKLITKNAYHTFEEAEKQLGTYLNDDSNAYSNISIMDDNQTIQEIILFDAFGKMYSRFYAGDLVQIRPEYMNSPAEAKYLYTISNIHEDTERCLISCVNSKLVFGSSEMVDLNMIKLVYHK